MALFTYETLNKLFPNCLFKTSPSWMGEDISTDTRTLQKGNIYIALKGEHFDGHQFIDEALKKGASLVVVDENFNTENLNFPHIKIDQPLHALEKLGACARNSTNAISIAITGSVGKTTTKEMLAHVLKEFGETIFSPASYNNHYGVPLSLSKLKSSTQYGVFEIGMNHPGEIAPLAKMACPDITIITQIAEAHIGQMGSLEAIALEKSTIMAGLSGLKIAILNRDDAFYPFLEQQAYTLAPGAQIISFGEHPQSHIQLKSCIPDFKRNENKVICEIDERIYEFTLQGAAPHLVSVALIALSVLKILNLPIEKAIPFIETFQFPKGRGMIHNLIYNDCPITLIDDAYNANPYSMRASLKVLGQMPTINQGRRIAILGEMRELGVLSQQLHTDLAKFISNLPIDMVITCGSEMLPCFDNLTGSFTKKYYENPEDLIGNIDSFIQPNDIILCKGSNGIGIHTVVNHLLQNQVDIHQKQATRI